MLEANFLNILTQHEHGKTCYGHLQSFFAKDDKLCNPFLQLMRDRHDYSLFTNAP